MKSDTEFFRYRYGEWALIAGASQGIGEQYSLQLAKRGLNLLMIARGEVALEALAERIRETYQVKVEILAVDLADQALEQKVADFIADKQVGLLVYNAVYSFIGEFLEDDLAGKQLTLDVNCKGPLVFLSLLLPKMCERKRGGVILMSSMSGLQGTAMVSTYAASKAFNTVLAESLWEEMRHHGVDVLACIAGATTTPNFKRQTPKDKVASVFPMQSDAVVSEALYALEKGKGPRRVVGRMNKVLAWLFQRLLSKRQAVEFMSYNTRKLYQKEGS